jgi:hypothetical protein
MGCLGILAISGFAALLGGVRLGGLTLLAHVAIGGVYAAALTVSAIGRSADVELDSSKQHTKANFARGLATFAFWVMVAGSLCLILTSAFMMLPQFGTEGQDALLYWHRFTAVIVLAAGILYALLGLAKRKRP